MNKLFFAFILLLSFCSCEKLIEEAAEDAIVDAMTTGQWVVTKYTRAGNDITTDFSGYKFQFHRNETVDAIKNATIEKSGTWKGDGNAKTINAQFNTTAEPLVLLNGTWQITNNSWTFVEASQTVAGEARTLRLDKQ
ncbi:MAG TPA: hypothetical protein VGD26_09360 [Chitinophagaceae bacterium]